MSAIISSRIPAIYASRFLISYLQSKASVYIGYPVGSIRLTSSFEGFKNVVMTRFSAKSFSQQPIPNDLLNDILELTIASPSSFNLQPYKLVIINDLDTRTLLANEAMLGSNKSKVQNAPLTIIFAAHNGKMSVQNVAMDKF